jgi:hypothetical protein
MPRTTTQHAAPGDYTGVEMSGVGYPQSISQPTFLTAREAAAFLRISPVTLGRWRIEGRGPTYRKFGRRVVYAHAELIGWAAGRHQLSTSATALDNRLLGDARPSGRHLTAAERKFSR